MTMFCKFCEQNSDGYGFTSNEQALLWFIAHILMHVLDRMPT